MPPQSQKKRYFFDTGYKVQLKPDGHRLTGSYLEGLHATVRRVELFPDPNIFSFDTQEEWEDYLRIRQVHFWVKLDDFPEIDEYYKQNEVQCKYRELRPLSPSMTKPQLAHYCKQHLLQERDEQRVKVYLQIMRYLDGERPSYPLDLSILPPNHSIDLINQFITWGANIRQKAQEVKDPALADMYEVQAQVCDILRDALLSH